jgi:hypothetical protein
MSEAYSDNITHLINTRSGQLGNIKNFVMTIVHAVTITFNERVSDSMRKSITQAAMLMQNEIFVIQSLRCGFDLGLNGPSDTDSFCLVAEFHSLADFETYQAHPAHLAFIAGYLRPRLESRRAVQFEI